MTGRVVQIFRHPIKSHGREELDHVTLTEGQTMPWDRRWAVAHEVSKADGSTWVPCQNFSRGSKVPEIMAIAARADEAAGTVTLTHPGKEPLTFDPDGDPAEFLDWVQPLMPPNRAQSARIIRVPGRGMTDTDFPSISLGNLSSHRAVEQRMGKRLSPLRWRLNIWMDGLGPWEEFEWLDRDLRIGDVEFRITERIERCMATAANPETGKRDADALGTLKSGWGHIDFGVYAVVTKGGRLAAGDPVERL